MNSEKLCGGRCSCCERARAERLLDGVCLECGATLRRNYNPAATVCRSCYIKLTK